MARKIKKKTKNLNAKKIREQVMEDFETNILKFAIFNIAGHFRNNFKLKRQCGDYSDTGKNLDYKLIKIKKIHHEILEDFDWLETVNRAIKSSIRIMEDKDVNLLRDDLVIKEFFTRKKLCDVIIYKEYKKNLQSPYLDLLQAYDFILKISSSFNVIKVIMNREKEGKTELSIDKKNKMYIRTLLTKWYVLEKELFEIIGECEYNPKEQLEVMNFLEKIGFKQDKRVKNKLLKDMKKWK